MAGIDKIYTTSFEEYKEFKQWADAQYITFFDDYKVRVGDWVRSFQESDFDGDELPIAVTPTWIDIYLIQNCKSDFVLARMKEVYGDAEYESLGGIDLKSPPPDGYRKNRKIIIKRTDRTRFPLYSRPNHGRSSWAIQSLDGFWYNEESRRWVDLDQHYPSNTNTAHVDSVKGVVRHMRNQYLPVGARFTLYGIYPDEDYTIIISK